MDFEIGLAGVQLGAFLILLVQTLKLMELEGAWLRFGPVLGALLFGALYALAALVPASAQYIELAVQVIAGIMTAVLGYGYVVKPVGEALGLRISATDLEE